ncbi:MAG TPA: tyrosine-type recombinase/integrase [Dehalococcoidia bacterium]|nr:tyrosine-type recombinase/integrase [Dehalococcoidia bacterium]
MLLMDHLTTLDTLIEAYRLNARIEGKSPKTVAIYTTALTILNNFLKQDGLPTDVGEIGVLEIRRFILYLQQTKTYKEHPYTRPQQKGLTGHTINCYLRAIRAFWSWLVSEEIIETNPFHRIKIPKSPNKVILPFTDDQIMSLLATIDTHSATGFRDWTMILTLLDTGIRVTELSKIELKDANVNQRSLKVWGKGAKERVVPIGGTVQRAIVKYVNRYRSNPVNQLSDRLFLTRAGEPLTANRIETIIENYGRKAGIEGVRCSPHTFRHTFAINYLRNGGDVFSLQRILGHSTLDMVKNYLNLAQSDLQAAHLRCSPVDNMQLKAGRASIHNIKRVPIEIAIPVLVGDGQ